MWEEPRVPRHVAQYYIVNDREPKDFILLHRSNKVKSARNVWALPSGTQKIGESVAQTIRREMDEELGLNPNYIKLISQYENIAGDADAEKQFHWVISWYLVTVDDVTAFKNKEPDKHDQVVLVPLSELLDANLYSTKYKTHESLAIHHNIYHNEIIEKMIGIFRMKTFLAFHGVKR